MHLSLFRAVDLHHGMGHDPIVWRRDFRPSQFSWSILQVALALASLRTIQTISKVVLKLYGPSHGERYKTPLTLQQRGCHTPR